MHDMQTIVTDDRSVCPSLTRHNSAVHAVCAAHSLQPLPITLTSVIIFIHHPCSMVYILQASVCLSYNFQNPRPRKFIFGVRVHLPNGNLRVIYQGHQFKAKVTRATLTTIWPHYQVLLINNPLRNLNSGRSPGERSSLQAT